MVLVVALADGVQAGNVRLVVADRARHETAIGGSLVIAPQAAHRVVDGREDLHRLVAWIDALELFVDRENAAQFAIKLLAREVREIEVYTLLAALDAQAFIDANVENLAGGD